MISKIINIANMMKGYRTYTITVVLVLTALAGVAEYVFDIDIGEVADFLTEIGEAISALLIVWKIIEPHPMMHQTNKGES